MSDINAVALKYLRELRLASAQEQREKTLPAPDQTIIPQTASGESLVRNTTEQPEKYERLFRLAVKSLADSARDRREGAK